jgi:hypothetical protein
MCFKKVLRTQLMLLREQSIHLMGTACEEEEEEEEEI